MPRRSSRPRPTKTLTLPTLTTQCPECGHRMPADYRRRRTLTTLDGLVHLQLQVRRCQQPQCGRFLRPVHPEQEGRLALPQYECGLDVIALVGALRYGDHRSVPEIHQALGGRGGSVCVRTGTNLLDRYDELLALSLADDERLRRMTAEHGRVILALDGLQPDVGHEVLWVVRDCL